MKTLLTTILFLLALTGCKIDLTIIGLGAVKTDSGSIDCAAGTTGDCHQEYVTNANDCTVAGNCTVVGANGTTETFNALPSDDSSFGGWGDICFGAANLQCTHTITPDYAADPDAQLNVTATFDPDPTPQNATYLYNAQGQRSSKTVNGVTTHFVYSDVDGQLLGEYNATGSPIREYIYLEGERVAMYDYTTVEPKDSTNQKAIVYLHNNQVGQVQYAFNSDGQMIYERVQTPFGETMGEINAYNLQMPVRFPGQYADAETGFNDNWNRTYDPSIGRYLQPDPIGVSYDFSDPQIAMYANSLVGLQEGDDPNHVYNYVRNNPLSFVDPSGLTVECKTILKLPYVDIQLCRDDGKGPYPNNPDNSPDGFDPIKGSKGKLCKEDGSVWERDNSGHGGDQWKRWPNKRSWERGDPPNSVWPDGRIRK